MLTYKTINDRADLRELVWLTEQTAPEWFKAANSLWHPTPESFETFWNNCTVHGLMDGDDLKAIVFIEHLAPASINVHVSVIEKVEERDLVRFFASLVRLYALEGVTVITGWIVGKNRGLLRVAKQASFEPTGLVMKYGTFRQKPLEWIQVRAN